MIVKQKSIVAFRRLLGISDNRCDPFGASFLVPKTKPEFVRMEQGDTITIEQRATCMAMEVLVKKVYTLKTYDDVNFEAIQLDLPEIEVTNIEVTPEELPF